MALTKVKRSGIFS